MFHIENRNDATVVHIFSDVDFAAKSSFREVLALTANQAPGSIIVDLLNCPYMDATGLGELLHSHRALGERLTVVLPASGIVARIFAVTGLDGVFNISKGVPPALYSEVA